MVSLISTVSERIGQVRVRRRVERKVGAPVALATGVARPRLVVIGNGMVSARFCEHLVRLSLHNEYQVIVVGEEAVPAYDRVNLAKVLRGGSLEELTLLDADWYAQRNIELRLGARVDACDLERKVVTTRAEPIPYDVLVFATGALPVVPKIDGVDSAAVLVYRSVKDAERLRESALEYRPTGLPVVVVGAGLLGLEAAEELKALGLSVELVESSTHLLPRQLDEASAEVVELALHRSGHVLHKGVRVAEISGLPGDVAVVLSDESIRAACFVVLAAGVRPRDELARQAGLSCDLFGGIVVNDDLSCSKPGVYAIGECARHRGISFGLVAPGYQMADALARSLAGHSTRFSGSVSSVRLKTKQVDVSVVGDGNVADLATQHATRSDAQGYRRLVVRRGKLIGLTVVGQWDEMHLGQQAVVSKKRVSRRDVLRFERGEKLFRSATIDLSTWPATAAVCSCTGVTCGTLRAAYSGGAVTPEALTRQTGAGSVCGSCSPLLASLCGDSATQPVRSSRIMIVATCASLLLAVWASFGPAVPYSDTVQVALQWDELWRSGLLKQLTGFSLVGITLLGLLISLRRRLGWLQRWSHRALRSLHIVAGAAALLAFGLHTGFRLGENLNFLLGLCFVAAALVGALAALSTILERSLGATLGGRLRRLGTRLHLWVVWPLPVLVLVHVMKVYFF